MDSLWVIGDDFGFKSFTKHFYERNDIDRYMMEHFEVIGFNNNKELSYDVNTISRMRNNLVGAVHDQKLLPKYVVVVLDDDIIQFARRRITKGNDWSTIFSRIVRYLMCQFDRVIATHKEHLPMKCKRDDEPKFIWIKPPTNTNFSNNTMHNHFSEALSHNAQYYDAHYSLPMKKLWDYSDTALFNNSDRKFTAVGYKTYWESVNKTVKYTDTLYMKKEARKKEKPKHEKKPEKKPRRNNKFHWNHR